MKENATEKDRAEYMEKLRNSDVYKDEMKKNGTGSALQQGVQAATAAIQGLAGGDMAKALAGASAPYLAEVIHNMTTDANGKVNVEANLMAHAVLGAVMAQVNGNSALAGASGAVMGEYIAQQMYPGINREDLTEEQRQTISALGTLASGLAGGLAGGSTADAVAGAQAGKNAVENNALGEIVDQKVSGVAQAEKYQNAQKQIEATVEEFKAQNCAGISADACSAKMQANSDELLKGVIGFGSDFVPIIGDIKSFAKAQSAIDYLIATVGLVPVLGDTAGKLIKAAETALKKGDIAEASNLINKASSEISAHNSANDSKMKDDLRQQNLDHIAKQDPRLEIAIKGDGTGKVNFGVGTGSREEADRLGMIWLGDGAKKTSGGGWVSADATRSYRPPSSKDSPFATTGHKQILKPMNSVRLGNQLK
ncbi:TPA: VENN motif pre-toxin domain-containing protein [Yersinia enterocolitica]